MAIAGRCALVTVVFAAAAACYSSGAEEDDTTPSAPWSAGPNAKRYDEIELARVTVPPSGGVVHAEGIVITIPAGALNTATPIIIKTVALFGEPVLPGTLAGRVYRLEPEGQTFALPVTIAVEPRRDIFPANAPGAIVLFSSPARRNQWGPRAASTIADQVVTAQTNAFSDWAPVLVAPTTCLEPACGLPPGATTGSVDCRVPAAGNGVRCTGTAPPYTCTCEGQPSILLAAGAAPTQDVLSVFGFACGGDCTIVPPIDASTDGPPTDGMTDGATDGTTDAGIDVAADVQDSG